MLGLWTPERHLNLGEFQTRRQNTVLLKHLLIVTPLVSLLGHNRFFPAGYAGYIRALQADATDRANELEVVAV